MGHFADECYTYKKKKGKEETKEESGLMMVISNECEELLL